jgi:carboxypeptidase C (cathepsin A)
MLDSRYRADSADVLATAPRLDASSAAISSAYKMTLLDYLQTDLAVDWDRPYLAPADPKLGERWNWNPLGRDASWEPYWVNTARDLSQAMEANPALNVFVASGYHDLVTPFFDAEFTLRRHGINDDRVDFRFYQGGHMMYVHEPSRTALLEDVREFIQAMTAD